MQATTDGGTFPRSGGILLGVGLGGFVDGIVFHQLLQWHHLASSAGYPPHQLGNLIANTWLDGLFHAATWLLSLLGLGILWRHARRAHPVWPARCLPATMLMGFGLFNLVEGVINHHLLGLHHVNETVPRSDWLFWDLAFLAWGGLMLAGGWLLSRGRKR